MTYIVQLSYFFTSLNKEMYLVMNRENA